MSVEMTHPINGSIYKFDSTESFDQWVELSDSCKKDTFYEGWIDRLEDVSATMRNLLKELVQLTAKIGKRVLRIGKIILSALMKIISLYPNTSVGMLLGFAFGVLCSSIPFLGWLLGPIVIPLFTLTGGITGYIADISNKIGASAPEIRSKIIDGFGEYGFKSS
jgi:hypothetical protein